MRTTLTAAGVFAGTNVDDLLVVTLLFVAARSGRPRRWAIVLGQAAGFTVLLAASVLISLGLLVVPEQWTRLLGVFPLAIGLRGLWLAIRRSDDDEPPPMAGGLLAVAGLTIVNGADDVSVYTPLLRTLSPSAIVVTIAVFYVGVACWCTAGWLLSTHPTVAPWLDRVQHWLGPAVFVAIGAVILLGVL